MIHEQIGLQERDARGANPDPVRCLPGEPAAYVVDPQLCAPSWEEPARVVGVEESKSSSHDVYHTDHVIENVGKPAALANSARRRVSPRVASSTAASSTAETVSAPRLLHCGGKPSASRLPRVFHGLCVSSGRQAQRHLASAKTRSDHRHGQYRSSMRKCPTIAKEDIGNIQVVSSWIQLARDWGIANQYPVAELIQVIRNAFGDQCEALLRCAEVLNPGEVQGMVEASSAEESFGEGAYLGRGRQDSVSHRMDQMYRLLSTILNEVNKQQNTLEPIGSAPHHEVLRRDLEACTQTTCHEEAAKRNIHMYIRAVQQIFLKHRFPHWKDLNSIPFVIQTQLAWTIVTGTIAPIRIACVLA